MPSEYTTADDAFVTSKREEQASDPNLDIEAQLDDLLVEPAAADPAAAPAGPDTNAYPQLPPNATPEQMQAFSEAVAAWSPDGPAPAPTDGSEPRPFKELAPQTDSTLTDVAKGVARGVPKAAVQTVETIGSLFDDALEAVGLDLSAMNTPEQNARAAAFKEAGGAAATFDKNFGRPQTMVGSAAQEITGLVAPAMGYMKLLQGASWVGKAAKGYVVANAIQAAGQDPGGNNLSTAADIAMRNAGVDPEKPYYKLATALSIDVDDATATRLVKNTIEGMVIQGTVGKLLEKAWIGARGWYVKRANTKAAAARLSLPIDEDIAGTADELVRLRLQKAHLDASAQPVIYVDPAGTASKNLDVLPGPVQVEPNGTALLPDTQSPQLPLPPKAEPAAPSTPPRPALPGSLEDLTTRKAELESQLTTPLGKAARAQTEKTLEGVNKLHAKASAAREALKSAVAKGEAKIVALQKRLASGSKDTAKKAKATKELAAAEKALTKAKDALKEAEVSSYVPKAERVAQEMAADPDHIPALRETLAGLRAKLATAADDKTAAALRAEIETVKAELKNAPNPRATVEPAGPQAAPKAPMDIDAPTVTPDVEGVPTAVLRAADAKRAHYNGKILDTENALVEKFHTSTADLDVLRIHKEELEASGALSPEGAARIEEALVARGAAKEVAPVAGAEAAPAALKASKSQLDATRATIKKTTQVVDQVDIGGGLKIGKALNEELAAAIKAGDYTGSLKALGQVFDSTNFDKITAGTDIKDLLSWFAEKLGADENSFRILTSRALGETAEAATKQIEEIATKSGSTFEAVKAGLESQMPGRDLTRTLTAYRMLELGLADRALTLSKEVSESLARGDTSLSKDAELMGIAKLAALVNDRRAGLVSDIARALNSLRMPASVLPIIQQLRQAGSKQEADQLSEYLSSFGGQRAAHRLARGIASARSAEEAAALTVKLANNTGATLLDSVYAWTIANTLSGPMTHAKNLVSTQMYMMVHEPLSSLFDAASRDFYRQAMGLEPEAMSRWLVTNKAKAAAFRKTVMFDKNMRAEAKRAWNTGRRITANPEMSSGKYLDSTGGNKARAEEIAKILRSDSHFRLNPWTKTGNFRVMTRNASNQLADALDRSASRKSMRLWRMDEPTIAAKAGARYGTAAAVIDFAGRVNSWPLHALAAADELNAGIAKSAALEGEAFGVAQKVGLKGQDALDFVRDIVDNIHTIDDLAAREAAGELDDLGTARLKQMIQVQEASDDYVRRMTFTQDPHKATQVVAKVRDAIPGGRWMMLFVRTPGNILETSIKETNLYQAGRAAGHAWQGNGEEAAAAAGKAAYASGVAWAAWEAIQAGNMTGSGPINPDARAMWLDEGNKPYTLYLDLGGEKPFEIAYGSLVDPIALPLQVMAEAADTMRYMDDDTAAAFSKEFFTRMTRLLGSKSWFNALNDIVDLWTGRAEPEKILVRVTNNMVPQSRLLATAQNPQLPESLTSIFLDNSGPDDGQVMTLAEYLTKHDKSIIDDGRGLTLDAEGNPVERNASTLGVPLRGTVAHIVSSASEPLPDDIRDFFIGALTQLTDIKVNAQRFPDRDLYGRIRNLPTGVSSKQASSVYNQHADPGQKDPVSEELRKQGLDYSTDSLFGTYAGIALSPEQQDFYHQAYAKPTKDSVPIYDVYKTLIESDPYKAAGDTIRGAGKGKKYDKLFKVHRKRLDKAQDALEDKFPEIKMTLDAQDAEHKQLRTQPGADAVRADRDARKAESFRAFEEALSGGN